MIGIELILRANLGRNCNIAVGGQMFRGTLVEIVTHGDSGIWKLSDGAVDHFFDPGRVDALTVETGTEVTVTDPDGRRRTIGPTPTAYEQIRANQGFCMECGEALVLKRRDFIILSYSPCHEVTILDARVLRCASEACGAEEVSIPRISELRCLVERLSPISKITVRYTGGGWKRV